MVYEFINFLFLFLSHISFIFSFSNSIFTASISTLPYSFFFPLPFWSILFLFVNMSHHRFPLYHHWSPSLFFFPPFVFSPLPVLSQSRLLAWVSGLWVSVLSWAVDSLFVVLRVADSLFYLWRFHRFTVSLKVSSIRSTSTAYR